MHRDKDQVQGVFQAPDTVLSTLPCELTRAAEGLAQDLAGGRLPWALVEPSLERGGLGQGGDRGKVAVFCRWELGLEGRPDLRRGQGRAGCAAMRSLQRLMYASSVLVAGD